MSKNYKIDKNYLIRRVSVYTNGLQ